MFLNLNPTISTNIDPSVIQVLKSRNCPVRVYRTIWKYVPHTNKPTLMADFEEELIKCIVVNRVTKSLNPDTVYKLKDHCGSYKNLVTIVRSYYQHRKVLKEKRILMIGPYVKLRNRLQQSGLMDLKR